MKRGVLLHGGALDLMKKRFPSAPNPWVDISTGINPWPYPATNVGKHSLRHLPTAAEFDLCIQSMAAAIGAPAEHLLLAPGSEILIRLLPLVLQVSRVCVTAHSYGDHTKAWKNANAQLIEDDDPLELLERSDALVLCNPNNPDGRKWPVERLLVARERLQEKGGWLIVDEAYADLDPKCSVVGSGGQSGLVVLRSFGKFYGLAGLRLGAMVAPPPVLEAMRRYLGVWQVSGPALKIGAAAYGDVKWQDRNRQRLATSREQLDDTLKHCGVEVVGGTDLFRLVSVSNAETTWLALAERGIYVRRFDWSEHYLRIGLPPTDNALYRLKSALLDINP